MKITSFLDWVEDEEEWMTQSISLVKSWRWSLDQGENWGALFLYCKSFSKKGDKLLMKRN